MRHRLEYLGFKLRIAFKNSRFGIFFKQPAFQVGLDKFFGPAFKNSTAGSKAFQGFTLTLKGFTPPPGRPGQLPVAGQPDHSQGRKPHKPPPGQNGRINQYDGGKKLRVLGGGDIGGHRPQRVSQTDNRRRHGLLNQYLQIFGKNMPVVNAF